MHPILDVRPWPRILLHYPLLILTAALLGAAVGFAYSYAPLHRAKDWKIDYLQGRLESRSDQVAQLEEELRLARSSLEGQPSNDQLKALRAQLNEAEALTRSLETQVDKIERSLSRATRSRDSWKRKHEATLAELGETKTARSRPATDAPSEMPTEPDETPEAAPVMPASPVATQPATPAQVPAASATTAPEGA